jgi:hypothetical protein
MQRTLPLPLQVGHALELELLPKWIEAATITTRTMPNIHRVIDDRMMEYSERRRW